MEQENEYTYLRPKSNEQMFGKMSNQEIFKLWQDTPEDYPLDFDIICYEMLVKRKADQLKIIKDTQWYKNGYYKKSSGNRENL